MPRKALPLEDRFWRYVTKRGPNTCWTWRGAKDRGYGAIRAEPPTRKMLGAHRVSWEIANGPIPDGVECDHLCRNRACVNPRHIALVTHRENTRRGMSPPAVNARKTHCPAGHPYSDVNTYVAPDGWRQCMTCRREYQRMLRKRRR